jgi:hypothetical protein
MMRVAAIAFIVTAVGLLCGADQPRGMARWPRLASPARARLARGAALLLIVVALLAWRAAEPGPGAFLAVPVAVMAAGSVVTLLAAWRPRLTWALITAALPLGVLLALLGGADG